MQRPCAPERPTRPPSTPTPCNASSTASPATPPEPNVKPPAKHLADLRLPVDAIARRLSLHHDTVVRLLRRDDEPAAPRRIDLRLRTRTAVEQAIARGIPGDQIIADHAITYRQLREIRRGME